MHGSTPPQEHSLMKTVLNHSKLVTTAAIIASAFAAAACSSDSVGVNGNSSAQLAFSTATTSASFATAPVTSGGHTLDLTDVTVTVTRAELKRAQSDACPGDQDNEGDDDHPRD